MSTTSLSFSSPDVALVAELNLPGNIPKASITIVPDTDLVVSTALLVSSDTYSTLQDAHNAAVAIDPNYDGEQIWGAMTLTPEAVSPSVFVCDVGQPITISSLYASSETGTSFTYEWYKDGVLINGATGSTITDASLTEGMRGEYTCRVTATKSSKNLYTEAETQSILVEPTGFLEDTDVIGKTDPYGSINTGRGDFSSGGDPLDLNFTYVTLIDTTYTQSELELYVPETNTTIPYVTNLPAPYHFDSNGACFTGTDDFKMEIRVAATSLVLGEVFVPGPQTINSEIYFWAP